MKNRSGYEHIVHFTKAEQPLIKDIRFVKYKTLSYEIEHRLNNIRTFDSFLKKQLIFDSPQIFFGEKNTTTQNTQFNTKRSPSPKIRNNLPEIKKQHTSGSDVENSDGCVLNEAYGLCDNQGVNEVMVQTTIHAHCSCIVKPRHYFRKSFFKPTLVIECSAHGPGATLDE